MEVDDYRTPDGTEPHTGFNRQALGLNYRLRTGNQGMLEFTAQQQIDEDVWYPGSRQAHNHPAVGHTVLRSPEQERTLYEAAYEHRFGGTAEPVLRASIYQQEVHRLIRGYSEGHNRDIVRTDVTFSTLGSRLNLNFAPGERHVVSLGLDAWEMQGDPKRYQDRPTLQPPNPNDPFADAQRNDPFSDGRIQAIGVYLQDEILFDSWTFKAGARFDRIAGDAAESGNPNPEDLEHTATTLSWSLGGVYHLAPALNPYANLGRAYRAADMRERFEWAPRGDGHFHQGNPQLDPEVSTTLELGIKGATPNTRYAVAAFHSRIDDYITGRVTDQTHPQLGLPIKRTENLAEVTLTGLEAEFERRLVGHYLAFGYFTYLRGENKHDSEPLAEVPPREATMGLRYAPPRGFNWDAAVRTVARQDRIGSQLTNNTEDETRGFTTVDVGMGYRFGPLLGLSQGQLRFAVANLLDESYHEHLTAGRSGEEPNAPGRNLQLTLNAAF
ncbi:hypothetical protein CAI21_13685 [Alkalilimnicola ehrlichii]|uniref:TonB-dependent receptor-like beta-barrel domain-containing protein n=1 Tax=Alkalilimnicola ehrlichii TaxID=351052 RepID=A0A3E0WQY8_9GAMM|nr:TonB-dependent receptor [Alkalilimnicola ehrlichii]RFA27966.1 hypothetical protein CAI21_13685 [Alkalilimnicola ehrlichii]RFA34613.1 hypothetical protein CAL65_14710 [Alkalilimnicola ehrlichii]